MEVIGIVESCLIFKINKKKYLFGLTQSLQQNKSVLNKVKVDHVCLPSQPYNLQLSLFHWHLDVLPYLMFQSIVVADSSVKKCIQSLIIESKFVQIERNKIQFFKHHQFTEEQLFKWLSQAMFKIKPKILFKQPNGLGFNLNVQKLNLIIPQNGRTVVMIHKCDTYLIDPAQNIQALLNNYGIPLHSIKAIILTKPNLNILEIMLKIDKIIIITEPNNYNYLIKRLKSYFLLTQKMIKNKIKGKIICQPQQLYHYSCLDFSYVRSKDGRVVNWDIVFCKKRVRIYSQQLAVFPKQIFQLSDLELLIVYQMTLQIKKQLQKTPQMYRTKIIFNRTDKKYNNKYFYRIRQGEQLIQIIANQYYKLKLQRKIGNESIQYQKLDSNGRMTVKQLVESEKFNSKQRVVHVIDGYVFDQQQLLYGKGSTILGFNQIQCHKSATIMYEPITNIHFYQHWKHILQQKYRISEDLLHKIKDNSFISSLSKTKLNHKLLCNVNQKKQEIQIGSEWDLFSSLCIFKHYQVGEQIQTGCSLFFIVKGGIKFRNNQMIAIKNMCLGTIRSYYCPQFTENDEIQVVKDSWIIEVKLLTLHLNFLSANLIRLIELMAKPEIFQ